MAKVLADSCSKDDVATAVGGADPGDIVIIPPGRATYSAPVTINKRLTVLGCGMGRTILDQDGTANMFYVELSEDVPVRIGHIDFRNTTISPGGDSPAIYVYGKMDGSVCYSNIRIDHCRFVKGLRILKVRGWVQGVIDHNHFLNTSAGCNIYGDNNQSWTRAIAAGTPNALFIEDNNFELTNDASGQTAHMIYHSYGARTVTRYNTFDGSTYDASDYVSAFFDSHGNQNYYSGTGDYRGQPILEVYGNSFHAYRSSSQLIYFRSGSNLIWGNDFILETGTALIPYFYEEEEWAESMFDPLRTEWPAEDQVTNTFIWANTGNWVGDTCDGTDIIEAHVKASSRTFIQKDREYFLHAPAANGGKSTYPTRAGADDMQFSAEGPNAHYPYVPYRYPHPLVLQDTIAPIKAV